MHSTISSGAPIVYAAGLSRTLLYSAHVCIAPLSVALGICGTSMPCLTSTCHVHACIQVANTGRALTICGASVSVSASTRHVHADAIVASAGRALSICAASLSVFSAGAARIRIAVHGVRIRAFGVHSIVSRAMALREGAQSTRLPSRRLAESRVGLDTCTHLLCRVDVGPRCDRKCTVATGAL